MTLLEKIKGAPATITFQEVMEYIDENYDFTPTGFTNGKTINEPGQNNGSCKIFSFAQLHNLSKEEALNLFGEIYRVDVLEDPNGTGHQNIRNFMETGWEGIEFHGNALKIK
ncbi:HopJ type III effector protein [Echinicola jeungdonensis]|uniref:HopJ type III effector protein n=1 Tax=Echinicola jeungdonensis TaxID=709343 RepID=A0ABV5J2H5_9BACT|nr:HopJ type III effector protein [Echinicola jeungdonensis]MDN3667967.1 HopJ type III effector protein [Echinicola jeungdonensis]